jgi:hypothetical protein
MGPENPRGSGLDLVRPDASTGHEILGTATAEFPTRTGIDLFDMAWWVYFRGIQWVARSI